MVSRYPTHYRCNVYLVGYILHYYYCMLQWELFESFCTCSLILLQQCSWTMMYWIFYQGICHNSFILWVVHIISYIHLYSCWMLLSYFVWAYTLHSFHHMYSILVGYEKTHGEWSMILCVQMFLKKIITKKLSINAFFWWMADIYFPARYNQNST